MSSEFCESLRVFGAHEKLTTPTRQKLTTLEEVVR